MEDIELQPELPEVILSPLQKQIESYKSMGLMSFKTLDKKVCIDNYEIYEDKIDFTLKTERGEYLHFGCKNTKLPTFLANFLIDTPQTMEQPEIKNNDVNDEVKDQTIGYIRSSLFDALDGLRKGTMDANTAKTIANVSQVLLNSCKLEMDYRKQTGKGNVKMLD